MMMSFTPSPGSIAFPEAYQYSGKGHIRLSALGTYGGLFLGAAAANTLVGVIAPAPVAIGIATAITLVMTPIIALHCNADFRRQAQDQHLDPAPKKALASQYRKQFCAHAAAWCLGTVAGQFAGNYYRHDLLTAQGKVSQAAVTSSAPTHTR